MASLLKERSGVAHLSSGNLLRETVKEGGLLGKKIGAYIAQGTLVPDAMVTDLMLNHVEKLGRTSPFVLDGFPRTKEQAFQLDQKLKEKDFAPVDLAVNFKMDSDCVVRRLSGRRVCSGCGFVYHLVALPPAKEGVCDQCAGKLVTRSDDREETIRKRLKVYHLSTEPLLDFYANQGKLRSLSAEQEIEAEFEELAKLLGQEKLGERIR